MVLAAGLGGSSPTGAVAQEAAEPDAAPPAAPHADLLLVVTLPKVTFPSEEAIVAHVMVTSIGSLPLKVPERFADFLRLQSREVGKPWVRCSSGGSSADEAEPLAVRELAPGQEWQAAIVRLDSLCNVTAPGTYEVSVLYSLPPDRAAEGGRSLRYAGFWQGQQADAKRFTIVRRED